MGGARQEEDEDEEEEQAGKEAEHGDEPVGAVAVGEEGPHGRRRQANGSAVRVWEWGESVRGVRGEGGGQGHLTW